MSSVPYLFVPFPAGADRFDLPPDAGRHVRTVLRMRSGEPLILFDGAGAALRTTIDGLDGGRVRVAVDGPAPVTPEPSVSVRICQALPKGGEKVEQVLQHGTELGADGFHLFLSARCVARPDASKLSDRMERWRRIVQGASEQSHRARLPQVHWSGSAPGFGDALALVLHEGAGVALGDALPDAPPERIALAVGPEGGFTDDEVARWVADGARAVHLGPRILRTETAALSALTRILARYGD